MPAVLLASTSCMLVRVGPKLACTRNREASWSDVVVGASCASRTWVVPSGTVATHEPACEHCRSSVAPPCVLSQIFPS